MKGLLHRLAARATGSAAMLRPDLQGPMAAAALAPGDTLSVHDEAWAAVADSPSEAAGLASQWPLARTAVGPTPLHAALGMDSAALPPQLPRPDPRPASQPPASSARPQATADNPPRGSPSLDSDRPASVGRNVVVTPAALPPLLAHPQFDVTRQASATRLDEPAPPADVAEGGERAWPSPPLLMPGKRPPAHPTLQPSARWTTQPGTQTVAPLQSAAARAPAGAGNASVSVSEPAEVHIHIGRIDVTAVREAPQAARRRPAAAPAPPSLDTYLAQRRHG